MTTPIPAPRSQRRRLEARGTAKLRFLSTSMPCTQARRASRRERSLIIAPKPAKAGICATVWRASRVPTPTRARRLLLRGVTKGSDIMRKSLRRILERLRTATNGRFRGPTTVRGGLQEPQRMQPAYARHVPAAPLTTCVPQSSPPTRRAPAGSVRSRPTWGDAARRRRRRERRRRSGREQADEPATARPALADRTGSPRRLRARRQDLGRLDVDVVLLQHEYGIYGGRDGEYVLSFVEELAQPLVVTLHTVLSAPTPHQLEVLTELCAKAELVIVMTDTALRLLVDCGACPADKVRVVPHGAPSRLIARAPSSGPYARTGEPLHAFHIRADLARQGAGDGDRGAAVDDRASPRDRLHDRRAHASRRRAPRRRTVPPHAPAARARARAR